MALPASAPDTASRTHIVTVGGGKGGVGKSVIACNLASAFAQLGHKVVLVDLDLGAANQHLLCGVTRPQAGVEALLEKDDAPPEAILTPTALSNLHLVAGTGAVLGAANISHAQKRRALRRLRGLGADVVIVDVGAGVSYNALDFFNLGAQKLLVTTPQITALHDAYSFLKSSVLRLLRHAAEKQIEAALLEPALRSAENEKVSVFLERLKELRPTFAAKVFDVLSRYSLYVVGNQVQQPNEAGVFTSVAKMMNAYLNIPVPILGWLRATQRVHESVNRRRPLAMQDGTEESRTFRRFAQVLWASRVDADEVVVELDLDDEAPPARAPAQAAPATRRSSATGERRAFADRRRAPPARPDPARLIADSSVRRRATMTVA